MKNKKVLHTVNVSFVTNYFFGNQFKYLKEKTGNTYYLACSPSEQHTRLAQKFDYIPFSVPITRSIDPITDIKTIYQMVKFIKKHQIDTIVGHTPKGGMVAMIAGYIARVPERIYFRHGIVYETSTGFKRTLLKSIDKLTGTLAHKVVCVSNAVKMKSEQDNLNDPKKNLLLGLGTCNGVDSQNNYNPKYYPSALRAETRANLGIAPEDFVVGFVGRLVKDKGIGELIDAWKIVISTHSNAKLLLVGPIEVRDALDQKVIEFIKNEPSIIHTGFVENSATYLSIIDTLILPTYREGFPTVILEASSMEKPILITRATGCEESIIENTTGRFITHDPVNIAENINYYIQHQDIAAQHGKAGRVFVQKHFEQTIIWDIIHKELKY